MIQLLLHDETFIALANAFEHKDIIKLLADYPEVQWHAASKHWLIHVGLLDKLIAHLGEHLEASVDFWLGYPIIQPSTPKAAKVSWQAAQKEKQKKEYEDLKHAQRWGKQLAEVIREKRESL